MNRCQENWNWNCRVLKILSMMSRSLCSSDLWLVLEGEELIEMIVSRFAQESFLCGFWNKLKPALRCWNLNHRLQGFVLPPLLVAVSNVYTMRTPVLIVCSKPFVMQVLIVFWMLVAHIYAKPFSTDPNDIDLNSSFNTDSLDIIQSTEPTDDLIVDAIPHSECASDVSTDGNTIGKRVACPANVTPGTRGAGFAPTKPKMESSPTQPKTSTTEEDDHPCDKFPHRPVRVVCSGPEVFPQPEPLGIAVVINCVACKYF